MKKKQSLFDTDEYKEYVNGGGLSGEAVRVLQDELRKAQKNKGHPLRKAANAFQEGDQEQAIRLIVEALRKADGDESSPLSLSALMLYRLPLLKLMLEHAEKNFDDRDVLKNMPLQIIQWAGIGVGIREVKARQGRGKGKANRERVRTRWLGYGSKEKSAEAFAGWLHDNPNEYNKKGEEKRKLPSVKKIAEIVRQLPEYRTLHRLDK